MRIVRTLAIVSLAVTACSKKQEDPPGPGPVNEADRARAAALVGELKKTLVGALTGALGQGASAAVEMCHTMAPSLTASLAREGAVIGRATERPRNPLNEARGWQAEALTTFQQLHAKGTPLAGQTFARTLPDGRLAYAEPLVIQEMCLTCHGSAIAPEVQAVLAAKYPADKATGYAVGDLRGIAWVELPATR
jgi:hypothetical protein